MKTKKTIAAIAALMIAVLSVSSLPFAVSANADNIPAVVESAKTETVLNFIFIKIISERL